MRLWRVTILLLTGVSYSFAFQTSAPQPKYSLPQSKNEWTSLIVSELQDGKAEAAKQLASQALQRWPGDSELLHLRGLAYFRLQTPTPAIRDLKRAQELAGNNSKIPFDLGLVYMATLQYELAATEFEYSLSRQKHDADSAMSHILLGRAYQNSNRTRLAIEQFRHALELDPQIPLGHYHLGFAYESLGESQPALAEFRREVSVMKANAEVLYQYGHLLSETGAWGEAIQQLKTALQIDPTRADAQYDLGKTLLLLGSNQEAIAALQRSIELSPQSANNHYQLSRALMKMGDRDGARREMELFSQLKKIEPQSGATANGLAR